MRSWKRVTSLVSKDTLILALVLAVAVGGTSAVLEATVEHLLHHDAAATARAWASYLAKNVWDLEDIVGGKKPSIDSQRFFDRAQQVGQVFRYKVYDPTGRLRLVSDEIAHEPDEDEDLAAHNPEGARSIAAGQPLIEVEEGRPPARPLYFVEAYVPVVLKGKTIAIIEVYVDQTEKRSDYRSTFVVSTLALGALVALAFSVPAVAWRRRTLEKRVVDDRIRFLALHDSLTGLPNRVHLVERIGRALIAQRERGGELALHAIDIDHFKDINDTLGHETGDALIRAVAERLSVLARTDDIVARLGGDEFIVLQTRLVATDCPLRFGRAIVDDLARPYAINGHFVGVTASVGVAIGPQHGADAVRLMKSADLALYRSKADGRKTATAFSAEMEADLAERLRIEQTIRAALADARFELQFQPIVQMPERRLVGFEALLRLRDEGGVSIPPVIFIPIAEQMGLINAIGAWVLGEACKTATTWPSHLKVAVNLSPAQFADGDLCETVVAALGEAGLEPARLELEITEGLLLKDSESVMRILGKLKSFSVGIVMDDFGTGYSSLSYLWKFPFDKLKIDRAFMLALDADDHENAEAIVKTIIDLGRSLAVTVTVEGVENDRQVRFVEAAGCNEIQGYYFARPLPVGDLAAYILRDLNESLSPAPQGGSSPPAIAAAG